mgnify:CR=1 FL=1
MSPGNGSKIINKYLLENLLTIILGLFRRLYKNYGCIESVLKNKKRHICLEKAGKFNFGLILLSKILIIFY